MTFATSDLTPLLRAAPTAQMRYASGVIVAWNGSSFENVVEVRGTLLVNLPVLSGPDAITYKAGDVVALVGADQQGARGIASYAILGRFVVPGAGKAEAAIEWMTSELGRAIAAAVFADRVENGYIFRQVTNPNELTWEDAEFDGAPDPGPSVEMEISERGAAIVLISASIGSQDNNSGEIGFEVSGATAVPPAPIRAAFFGDGAPAPGFANATVSSAVHVTDLNPGVHKFECKYHSNFNLDGLAPGFSRRSITVIGF